jgi:hypothetical protein
MRSKTLNPLAMLGSYLGLAAGYLLALKGWYIFWWLPALLGLNFGAPTILNAVGGFIAGYLLQILWRIFNYRGLRKVKNIK